MLELLSPGLMIFEGSGNLRALSFQGEVFLWMNQHTTPSPYIHIPHSSFLNMSGQGAHTLVCTESFTVGSQASLLLTSILFSSKLC